MSEHFTMKNLPESERPYEKFLSQGVESLSDAELLAIIVKNGTKEESSLDIARKLLHGSHNNLLNLYDLSYHELMQFSGIGQVKAIQLKAVAELSKRISKTNSGYTLQMDTPSSIAAYYMEQLRHSKEELLICAFFDSKCNFLGDVNISKGSVNYAYVSPRDIFLHAFDFKAVLFVMIHNHPSGDPFPSEDDMQITYRIGKGAQILELQLADHIIIGDNRYYSFKESGKLII
ncbi:MAG: DNA repair protein RadC [Agathobacter sp.]|nr:DNA repair protein RadC [Agathobacter sp.]